MFMGKSSILAKDVLNNLNVINERIAKAAKLSGRKLESIRLVVVTKRQPGEVVQAALDAGLRDFGENYPEQAVEKIHAFSSNLDIRWHMIGHLQRRKANLVVQHFQYMHSLDSISIAERLNGLLADEKRTLPVLLEFNVGGEVSKHGWQASDEQSWDKLLPEVASITKLAALQIRGLMTMPPISDNPLEARKFFAKLYRLREFLKKSLPETNWEELSMGTSTDFEAAILEGATIIRLGEAILGPRH
jgi:pyridoxal phosphate enzyme (YggS family)